MNDREYPDEAYTPTGELWWRVTRRAGSNKKLGGEQRIAAWLAFNVEVGGLFTMRGLREALGKEAVPDRAEHLNRRLRNLRPDGWVIPSNKDDRTLAIGTYRLEAKGWHPGMGRRPRREAISQGLRRRAFDRDGRRCVVCGIAAREPYPDDPNARAVLTVGHRIPRERGGSSTDINNLQTECKHCNEPVRHELASPETLDAVVLDVRRLRKAELQTLLSWLRAGHRMRTRLDAIYDRVRALSAGERAELQQRLAEMLGGNPNPGVNV